MFGFIYFPKLVKYFKMKEDFSFFLFFKTLIQIGTRLYIITYGKRKTLIKMVNGSNSYIFDNFIVREYGHLELELGECGRI